MTAMYYHNIQFLSIKQNIDGSSTQRKSYDQNKNDSTYAGLNKIGQQQALQKALAKHQCRNKNR